MKVIYMQSTIDLIIAQGRIKEVETIGAPEIIQRGEESTSTYYRFTV